MQIIYLICFSLFITIACSQEREIKNSLHTIASEYTSKNNPPGLALAVIKDGDILWSYSYGYSDIEKKTPMDTAVIMNIASVSKTITTTAILQLWEKGKLDLDADINEYLDFTVKNPNFQQTPITIKQLLTHTSSINDTEEYGNSYKCGDPDMSLSDWLINYFRTDGKFYDEENNFHKWEPGKDYKYSNVGFGLLGLIVEMVSQQTFSDYCKSNIMAPLNMKNAAWYINEIDTLKQAKQYSKSTQENVDSEWLEKLINKPTGDYLELCNYSFYNYPDGLFKSTISDLSHFMIAIMNQGIYDGQQILSKTTVSEMLKLQLEDNNIQGLGWKKIYTDTSSLWGHSGRDPGVRTHMYFNPQSKIGIILFQNNGDGTTINLIKDIYSVMEEPSK